MSRRVRRHAERNRREVDGILNQDERLLTIQEAENESEISISRQARTNYEYPGIKKIIVAEDQLVNLQLIKSQIENLGLTDKTIFCTDGQQTVNAFSEELLHSDTDKPVTLILTDLQMPQKNGLKVASEIRELIYRFSTRQERHI